MESLINYFDIQELGLSMFYLTLSILIFIVGKFLFKLTNSSININHEVVEKDNLAFIISYVGYFASLIMIIIGALIGDSHGILSDTINIFTFSVLGMLLLQISILINNKFILNKFDIKKEIIEDKNAGTGMIEAAIYIGNSFILFGAISGESNTIIEGIFTCIIYWLLGNIVMVVSCKIFIKWLGYDIHHEIETDNVAAGTAFAGAIVAICTILMNALIDPFENWIETILNILIYGIIGILILPLIRWFSDKILIIGRDLNDEICNQEVPNIGAGLIEAFSYIGASILIICTF